jgi:hypothetical protein
VVRPRTSRYRGTFHQWLRGAGHHLGARSWVSRTKPTSSLKHQSSPGSSERTTGWWLWPAWPSVGSPQVPGPSTISPSSGYPASSPPASRQRSVEVPVAVPLEELIQRDAGHTGGVGAVDDDLVLPAEPPEHLLWTGKVQRSRDVFCPVLPVAQGVHELQGIPTVQLLLELLRGYQPHVHPRVAPTKTSAWHLHLDGTIPGGSVSLIWSRWVQPAIVIVPRWRRPRPRPGSLGRSRRRAAVR